MPLTSLKNQKYKIKVNFDESGTKIYFCSCPAWKFQKRPIHKRTCKHLKEKFGEDCELKRIGTKSLSKNTNSSTTKTNSKQILINPMKFKTFLLPKDRHFPKTHKSNIRLNDLSQWYYSIKLNGAFIRWHPSTKTFYTKGGHPLFNVPPRIYNRYKSVNVELDCELYCVSTSQKSKTINNFGKVIQALNGVWDSKMDIIAFDVVDMSCETSASCGTSRQKFDKRLKILYVLHKKYDIPITKYKQIKSPEQDFKEIEKFIIDKGQEGIVLRHPCGMYENGKRSNTSLKWKPFFKSEAKVVNTQQKKQGQSLIVEELSPKNDDKNHFKIYDRLKKHKVGDTVKFIYSGRHENGNPEFTILT